MADLPVILYSYWRSSCSWRVRIALNLKNIPYTYKPIRLAGQGGDQDSPDFMQLNPNAQVPVLQIDNHRLTESVAILEYLEETRPQHPLLPTSPFQRSQVRMLVEIVNAGIQPKQNLSVINYVSEHCGGEDARKKFAAHWVRKGLTAFEKELEHTAGKCCVGDQITFADVCIVPQSASAARFDIDIAAFPRIAKIVDHLQQLPEFQKAHASVQPDAI